MLLDVGLDSDTTLLPIGEVESNDSAAAVVLAYKTESLSGTFTIVMVVHHDCEAVAGDSMRNRTPDSFTRSGNQDGSAHCSLISIDS